MSFTFNTIFALAGLATRKLSLLKVCLCPPTQHRKVTSSSSSTSSSHHPWRQKEKTSFELLFCTERLLVNEREQQLHKRHTKKQNNWMSLFLFFCSENSRIFEKQSMSSATGWKQETTVKELNRSMVIIMKCQEALSYTVWKFAS